MPMPGGPMGGPMGGPRGPMGPMGGPRGPMGNVGINYFRPGGPNRPAAGGHVDVGGKTFTESLIHKVLNVKDTFHFSIKRKGLIGGIFLAPRILISGSLRYDSFVGKTATYDKQYNENRITEQQCKERKMIAARKYHRYLLKTGYITQDEYNRAMDSYASSIGVNYVNDVDPQQSRSR